MTTIRVARAYTKRNKIIKFAGSYHGHSDLVLVAAGSGPSQLGSPDSAGVPKVLHKRLLQYRLMIQNHIEKLLIIGKTILQQY